MLTADSLRARIRRIEQVCLGLAEELARWKTLEARLLDAERAADLNCIQDGIAGIGKDNRRPPETPHSQSNCLSPRVGTCFRLSRAVCKVSQANCTLDAATASDLESASPEGIGGCIARNQPARPLP
jgi:hypothetical protein